MKRLFFGVLVALTSIVLTACGGGGGGGGTNPPAGTAEGLWDGTTSNSRFVSGVVLDDDTYWVLYSVINSPGVIAGVIQGNGNSTDGVFSSSNTRDYNFEGLGILSGSISANYAQKTSFDGTVTYSTNGEKVTFNADYNTSYDKTPSLAAIAGTYQGTATASAGTEPASITISGSGDVTGLGQSGCAGIGTISPRSSGNVYNVSITFQGFPCANGNSTVTGVAYYDDVDGIFYSAALNSSRTDGFLFLGQ